jgi:adenylate cyclase
MADVSEEPLLVAFTDFNRYAAQVERRKDAEIAEVMGEYYEFASGVVTGAGGRVVKFIGDAMLAVFPADEVDSGVLALLDLKDASDRYMVGKGWDCRLTVKAHFGPVVSGLFGGAEDKRYDVLGKTVNSTARLESRGVALSVEAFRRLGPDTRKRFRKHAAPITYNRLEDSHR